MKSEVFSVISGTPTLVLSQDGSANYPMAAALRNMAGETIYFGGSDVTTVNGFPIDQGSIPLSVDVAGEDLYAICTTGPAELRVLRRGG
jgi:hypothetical protein